MGKFSNNFIHRLLTVENGLRQSLCSAGGTCALSMRLMFRRRDLRSEYEIVSWRIKVVESLGLALRLGLRRSETGLTSTHCPAISYPELTVSALTPYKLWANPLKSPRFLGLRHAQYGQIFK